MKNVYSRLAGLPLAMLSGLLSISAVLAAAPAELLPADTLAVFTIPDWQKASASGTQSAYGRLWMDPAVKPFRENFIKNFSEDVLVPLERELGIKFSEYASLLRGQVTIALTRNGWDGKSENQPGVLILIDTRDQGELLKKQLGLLKQKWTESGKKSKSESIRGIEFTTLMIHKGDLNRMIERAFPSSEPVKESDAVKDGSFEVTLGQADSLLLISSAPKDLEKVLIRHSGGATPSLGEQAAFGAGFFRDALAYVWLDFNTLYQVIERGAVAALEESESGNPFAPKPEKVLAAAGLNGLKTVALKVGSTSEGSSIEVFLGIPEASRQGLFKVITPERKEASPPAFVPADAVKFTRARVDGQKAWATIESMLTAISPEMVALFQMGIATVGKDKDPNFDLKKSLIGNLGDDFISFEKNPRTLEPEDLNAPPSIFLIGSPNPEKLVEAVRAAMSLMPPAPGDGGIRERDFLGRKIYSLALPDAGDQDGVPAGKRSLNFASSAGYVAISADIAMLEQFLRSAESTGKSLREVAGLTEAAQKLDSLNSGFFGYENQAESMRTALELLKHDSARLDRILSLELAGKPAGEKDSPPGMKEWFDFKLLPAFDTVSRYFHFLVYSGNASAEGITWRMLAPTPPPIR